jgi:hypothetical protein
MAGTCKSDAIQNSKHRTKFAAQLLQKTWETHKAKVAKRTESKASRHEQHIADRKSQGKPERGAARPGVSGAACRSKAKAPRLHTRGSQQ